MYAIIDIETTGGSPMSSKITEIAVFLHNGITVTDEFTTLINPETIIPYYITSLTGITNAMVSDAPKFYEVARRIVELTQDRIFIAHNVNFDYSFIRQEFKALGYNFFREKLCTVQLSRKLIPGLPSYSLGKLCQGLGIVINGRHRAAGDALATVKLFEYLLTIDQRSEYKILQSPGLNKKDLHPNLDPETINSLPEETGVYYFYNDRNDLIYIGKSKNIRTRVLSHFRNYSTKKAIDMRNAISDISYELTGSELIALLKESHEIKQFKPIHNRSQRRAFSAFGIYSFTDMDGYIRFTVDKNTGKNDVPLCSFSTQKAAKIHLQNLVDRYHLCQKLCGLYPSKGACFHHEIGECLGACIGKESPENYNSRAKEIIQAYAFDHDNFFILDNGKSPEEIAVVMIRHGKYIGYGFLDTNMEEVNPESLASCIKKYDDNRDVQQILRNYLRQNKHLKIFPFQA